MTDLQAKAEAAADAVRAISEARDGALMMEVVDNGRWSLRFDFGTGDEACHRMRALAAAIRALPLPTPPEGEGI